MNAKLLVNILKMIDARTDIPLEDVFLNEFSGYQMLRLKGYIFMIHLKDHTYSCLTNKAFELLKDL
jgi:hypothetical protein